MPKLAVRPPGNPRPEAPAPTLRQLPRADAAGGLEKNPPISYPETSYPLFTIGYNSLWLVAVAGRCGAPRPSPATPEEMTKVFLMTPVAIAAVPWGNVLRHYVLPARARVA